MAWTDFDFIDKSPNNSASGKATTCRYYLLASAIASLPSRGDAADSRYVTAGWKVESAVADPLSPYSYLATITFVASLSSDLLNPAKRTDSLWADIQGKTDLSVGYGEVLITPDMLGLTLVGSNTGEVIPESPRYAVGMKDSATNVYYTAAELAALWVDTHASKFTYPLYFGTLAAPAVPNLGSLDRPVSVFTFSYVFYTDTTATLGAFRGVNPNPSDIPADCNVPNRATPYQWKAIDQNVVRMKDSNDYTYYQVTRTAIIAPSGYVWDAVKNQGVWTW